MHRIVKEESEGHFNPPPSNIMGLIYTLKVKGMLRVEVPCEKLLKMGEQMVLLKENEFQDF